MEIVAFSMNKVFYIYKILYHIFKNPYTMLDTKIFWKKISKIMGKKPSIYATHPFKSILTDPKIFPGIKIPPRSLYGLKTAIAEMLINKRFI